MSFTNLFTKYAAKPAKDEGEYLTYEQYFRGSDAALEGRAAELRALVDQVQTITSGKIQRWLDVGSGSGLLLDVLSQQTIEAWGVELDNKLALASAEKGHTVLCGEANAVLNDLLAAGVTFDAISCLHLIEHLEGKAASTLIQEMAGLLAPNGLLVLVTPNHQDVRVMLGSFYRDPTHIRPYPAPLLEYFCSSANLAPVLSDSFDKTIGDRAEIGPNFKKAHTRLQECKKILHRLDGVQL